MDKNTQRQVLNVLKNRHSHRKFIDKPIEDEILDEILDVGLQAASGGNLQPVSVIMVRDPERKLYLRNLCGQAFIETADTLLVFLIDYYKLKRWAEVQKAPFGREHAFRDYMISILDVMSMAQSIECAANILDIGSVYVGTVNAYYNELKTYLKLPELTVPILMTCLGYSTDKGLGRKKLSRKHVIHNEEYHLISDNEVLSDIVDEKYNNWIQTLEGELLDSFANHFEEVAATVNGTEWAQEVVTRIKEQGGINRAQYRFGWHYNPLLLRKFNDQMFDFLRNQGFKFLPPKE